MKKAILLILTLSFLVSCKNTKENNDLNTSSIIQEQEVVKKNKVEEKTNEGTFLCKINGKNWAYTKASGIIDTHARTKIRTAIFTFKKKLKKGSESIQLYYNPDTFKLTAASIQLRFLQKDGKTSTCYYSIKPETRSRKPQTELLGSIDLSNPTKAFGTAEIKNLSINYEKDKLQNAEDATIQLTGLKFSAIGYSNLDKIFKSLDN